MAQLQLLRPWQKVLVSLINYSMVALLASTLAYWVWVFYQPSPVPQTPSALENIETVLPTILASHWFSENKEMPVTEAKILNGSIKLIGVMSTSGESSGFAVFQLVGGKQEHVLLHHEIMPGVRLESINSDYVLVSQHGIMTKIELESR